MLTCTARRVGGFDAKTRGQDSRRHSRRDVTINSDDPSYFGGYLNDNYRAMVEHLGLSETEVIQLAKNSFAPSFISDGEKQAQLDKIDSQIDSLRKA